MEYWQPRLTPGTFEEKFVRGGGPGGQNVNKVATTVQLRYFAGAADLPPDVLARLKALAGSRLTAEGDIVIISSEYRTQEQNRQGARARLMDLLTRAARPPRQRRATKPTYGSKLRRLDEKKRRSDAKRDRRPDF
ncbi:MAG: aminoacyl-tRNA hydrolase [Elusimicrobia bacterium]|nr:aminoacyl-tRNA hydrolase [Elusimicrobiota bacterium]